MGFVPSDNPRISCVTTCEIAHNNKLYHNCWQSQDTAADKSEETANCMLKRTPVCGAPGSTCLATACNSRPRLSPARSLWQSKAVGREATCRYSWSQSVKEIFEEKYCWTQAVDCFFPRSILKNCHHKLLRRNAVIVLVIVRTLIRYYRRRRILKDQNKTGG